MKQRRRGTHPCLTLLGQIQNRGRGTGPRAASQYRLPSSEPWQRAGRDRYVRCKQGLFQPALPVGPQGGSDGWTPHRKPWGSWTQHTFTHLRKKMRNSQDHKSFKPKVLRCKTSTSFSFALRSSSKNGSWEYILNSKKRYTWNEHLGTQNSVIGGDSTQGHIAFGKICFFLATGTSPM